LVDERGASTLGDMLESELNPTDSVFMNEKNPELINLLLSSLTDKQKLIITAMFGLGGSQQRTLNDVADELNLSREAVRITQKKVLRKLRNKCNRLGITHNMF
jgi:RNA polymerase nonessential primary-like sigma factor